MSLESERGLLGAAVTDPDKVMPLALARGVGAEWFDNGTHAAIWEQLEKLYRAKVQIDAVLLCEELRRAGKLEFVGGVPAVEAMVEASPTSAHAEFYLDVQRDRMLARCTENAIKKFHEEQRTGAQVALDDLVTALRNLQERGASGVEVDKRALLAEKLEQWTEVARQRFTLGNAAYCLGVPLPWGCMNAVFNGLRPGLHIVGARTSVGKTVMGMNCSEYWCETGVPHAFVTLDMEDGELLTRYVSSQSRVSLRKLEWGARKDELAKAAAEIDKVSASCVHMTHERDVERLRGWLNMARNRWGIKAVVYDYLQLARFKGDRKMQRFERVCEATQMLKEIATDLKIPVLAMCQLNRDVTKAERENVYAEPILSDLGDSSEIEKAAASVTLMHRDQVVENDWRLCPPVAMAFGQEQLARLLRAMWLRVEKNQQGLAGVRLPFIMYPHHFIMRPAQYSARNPVIEQRDDPRTGRKHNVTHWGEAFSCIRDDWRHLPEDELLEQARVLGRREYGEALA